MKPYYLKIAMAALAVGLCLHVSATYAQVVDKSFVSPSVFLPSEIFMMKKAAKGKVYVAGRIDYHGEKPANRLVRLTPSGFLDTSFKPDLPENTRVVNFEVLPNGNLVVVVMYEVIGLSNAVILAVNGRRLAEIAQDYVSAVCVFPDNSFILAHGLGIYKYTKRFTLDRSFNQGPRLVNGIIRSVKLQGSKIILSGAFSEVFLGEERRRVKSMIRLNSNGIFDPTFQADVSGLVVDDFSVQSDGKILLTNNHSYTGVGITKRLDPDGSTDTGFNYPFNPSQPIVDMEYNNGKWTINTVDRIARLLDDGSVDPTFNQVQLNPEWSARMVVLPDNSFIVGNYMNVPIGTAKFTSGGRLTKSYKAQLFQRGMINAIDVVGDAIFVGGNFIRINNHYTNHVARLNLSGAVDTKLKVTQNKGPVYDIEGDVDGKALFVSSEGLHKVDRKGKPDHTFSFAPFKTLTGVNKFIVQDDGKIVVSGNAQIYRLLSNGSEDISFDAGTNICCGSSARITDFDLDRESGKIIVGGYFSEYNGSPVQNIVRINPNGSIDLSFNPPQNENPGGIPANVVALRNQKLLLGTNFWKDGTGHGVVKLFEDGTLDTDFLQNYGLRFTLDEVSFAVEIADRIVLAENDFYGGFEYAAIEHTGVEDVTFSFQPGLQVELLGDFYATSATELYVFGQLKTEASTKVVALARVQVDESEGVVMARASEENSTTNANENLPAEISFYPNPVKSAMTVQVPEKGTVEVLDFSGRRHIKATVRGNESVDLRSLLPGRYVVIISSNGKSIKRHLIKD